MPFDLLLVVVVFGFAVVQSVFGVGLLVFGTPTLLLVGQSFETTLAYLLPASLVISALQLVGSGGVKLDPMRRQFLVFTAPWVIIGTGFILTVGAGMDIRLIVGAMLIVSGMIRLMEPVRQLASGLAHHHLPWSLSILGGVHGLSNLGGGVLTVIVGSVYDDKTDIRRQVAFGYGLMAFLQLITLWITSPELDVDRLMLILLPVLSGLTYLIVGNRAFRAASQTGFQTSLTVLIILFGLLIVVGPRP